MYKKSLSLIRKIYRKADGLILNFLRQKPRKHYQPKLNNLDDYEIKKLIYKDFLKEQPSLLKVVSLRTYLNTRNTSARLARKIVKTVSK